MPTKLTAIGAKLIEVNGEEDHVHLLVEYAPTLQLSRFVSRLKGSSSRRLRAHRLSEVSDLQALRRSSLEADLLCRLLRRCADCHRSAIISRTNGAP
jgi:REP element-mobilizing transposase RayT